MPEHLKVWTHKDARKAVEADQPITGILRKQYVAEKIEDVGGITANILEFVISTASLDRDGDTIAVGGWDFTNWLKNPVVLFGHDYSRLPVGKGLNIWVDAGRVMARAEYPSRDVYEFGFNVYEMVKWGGLPATSVGFIPRSNTVRRDPETGDWLGMDFLTQELLEFSNVAVPSNPDAVRMLRSKGVNMAPYEAWVEDALDETRGFPDIWVPKRQLEKVWAQLSTKTLTTVPDVSALKSGRVLSAANETALKECCDHMMAAHGKMSAVLAQMTPDMPEAVPMQDGVTGGDTKKTDAVPLTGFESPAVDGGITFEGAGFESPDLGFDLDDDTPDAEIDLDALAIDDLKTLVAPSVREAVRHARMMATGRLD